jgi:hypothetical protein
VPLARQRRRGVAPRLETGRELAVVAGDELRVGRRRAPRPNRSAAAAPPSAARAPSPPAGSTSPGGERGPPATTLRPSGRRNSATGKRCSSARSTRGPPSGRGRSPPRSHGSAMGAGSTAA